MSSTILGQLIPPFADSAEFGDFIKSVYAAVNKNYLSASHVLKCDPMTVWRIVNNKQKDSPKIRNQWGIDYPTQPAPVCPIHNKVHRFDCQTEQVTRKRKPRPKSKPRTRIAADVTEEQRDGLSEHLDFYGVKRGWLFGRLGEVSNLQFVRILRILNEE
jgi:hypothetical protein